MSYRQALSLTHELDMRPLQAHCHHGLSTLYGKTVRPEPTRVELSAAIALYRAMEMTFWLSKAEVVLVQVVPRNLPFQLAPESSTGGLNAPWDFKAIECYTARIDDSPLGSWGSFGVC